MIKPGLKGVWSNLHVSCLNRVQSIRAQGKHYTLMWYFLKIIKEIVLLHASMSMGE